MKKQILFSMLILFSSLPLVSCNNETKTDSSKSEEVTAPAEPVSPCESFCKDYESFADQFTAFMIKYGDNSTDPTMLSEYAQMVQKANDLSQDPNNASCVSDPSFGPRILKAAEKIASSMDQN